MLPTEEYSGDATEDKTPWTPQVWRDGPDSLVAQAQQALFQNRADVEMGALGASTSAPAFAGSVSQGANEGDEGIYPGNPPETPDGQTGAKRATVWKNTLNSMRATNEFAGQVKPLDYDPSPEEANPAP